ncbi:MAG TPA: hypothetical protein VF939_09630 [Puia sp.]
MQPPLEEAQEVNTTEATAIASTKIKIVFLIFVVFIKLNDNCLVEKEELGPGNSKEGSGAEG